MTERALTTKRRVILSDDHPPAPKPPASVQAQRAPDPRPYQTWDLPPTKVSGLGGWTYDRAIDRADAAERARIRQINEKLQQQPVERPATKLDLRGAQELARTGNRRTMRTMDGTVVSFDPEKVVSAETGPIPAADGLTPKQRLEEFRAQLPNVRTLKIPSGVGMEEGAIASIDPASGAARPARTQDEVVGIVESTGPGYVVIRLGGTYSLPRG